MAKRKTNNLPAVKAGMFSNYSQWWLAGGDISSLMGAALMFSDSHFGRIQAATYNVWAANCIAARAETLAGVELKLYKKGETPEEEDEEIIDHPILELLEEVNPVNLKRTSFREQIERQLAIHGDCYIHKVRGAKGLPSEMYILPAQYVEPIPDALRLVAGYRYQTSTVLKAEDVIRIYYPSDENPLLARAPTTSAINAINNYSLSDLAQQGIDRRGGQGGGIVMVDFNAIMGDPQRFMAEWDAKRADPRNAGRDAFLPDTSSYQSGTLTAQQQQREERATRLIREIMGAYRVPPSLAGDYKDASVLANAAQQDKNFWNTFMKFELKRLEDAVNYDLLWKDFEGSREDGLYLKHDLSAVEALTEGEAAEATKDQVKATTADTIFAAGLISLNEARVYIGQEPIDDPRADEVMQPEVDPTPVQPADVAQADESLEEDIATQDPELDSLLEEAAAVKAVEDLLFEVDDFLLEVESAGESFLVEPVKAGKSAGGFDSVKQRKWYFAAKDDKKGNKVGGATEEPKEAEYKDTRKDWDSGDAYDELSKEIGLRKGRQTEEEIEAAKDYTTSSYAIINSRLRDSEGDLSKIKEQYVLDTVQGIDSVLGKSKLKSNIVVHRGAEWDSRLAVGATIKDHAFVSTSTSEFTATMFAQYPKSVIYHIPLKSGSKASFVAPKSDKPQEQEVLLPRGLTYKVKSITHRSPYRADVDLEIVE